MGKNVSVTENVRKQTHQAILHNGAEAQKVHDDLKLFVTLGEAKTKSAMSGHGVPHGVAEASRGPWLHVVESSQWRWPS